MRMEELARPAIQVVARRAGSRSRPRASPPLPGLDGEHPPVVHLRQLWWGHQIPVWYRGGEVHVRPRGARGRRLGAGPGRARHLVLERAVAVRDARLAGRHAGPAGVLPDRRAVDGARHPVPVGGAHGDDGPASSRGEIPFSDVYVHSVIQAPDGRRMSKSLGTGLDPLDLIDGGPRPPVFAAGRRLPGLRRRRRALRPAGDVLDAGRALQRGQDRPGIAAREQAVERVAAGADARGRDVVRRIELA